MSQVFGVPPPPAPFTYPPGAPQSVLERPHATPRPPVEPPADRWRRRGAVTAAFLAVSLLVFANLATWLHFSVIAPGAPSQQVAAATFDEASRTYTLALTPVLRAHVTEAGQRTYGGENDDALQELLEGERSKIDQIARWATKTTAFRAVWNDAVDTAMARQRVLAHGTAPVEGEPGEGHLLLTAESALLRGPITAALVTNGYFFMSDETLTLPDLTVRTDVSAYDYRSALGAADRWWLALWAGAVGFGALAVWLARRRLRMVTILAVDAAFMLSGTLLLLPLMRSAAASHTLDPTQAPLARRAVDALADTLLVQTLLLMAVAIGVAVAAAMIARRPDAFGQSLAAWRRRVGWREQADA